jgi:hypothetical protein
MRTLRVNALPVFLVIVRLFIHPAIVRRAAGGRIGALRFVEFILGGATKPDHIFPGSYD